MGSARLPALPDRPGPGGRLNVRAHELPIDSRPHCEQLENRERRPAHGRDGPSGDDSTVYVPTSAPASVTEGGRPAARSPGVKSAPAENGKAVFEVGSGKYEFEAKLAR